MPMDLSKSYEFFKPEMCQSKVHIIGCGSVGSTVAENLARFGITDMVLYDFDHVEEHNLVNQMFDKPDVGRLKVEATAEHILRINPECQLKLVKEGWDGHRLAGYVFLCCDGIELRRRIVESNTNNPYVKGMFDFRTRLTDAQHYAADWSDKRMVEDLLNSMDFSHEEAQAETPVSACNVTLSVAPTIRMIVAAGVANFVNFVKGEKLRKLIIIDAFNFTIDAF